MSRLNESVNSGGKDALKTPAGSGSTSPVHQERIVPQENTDGDLHLSCRRDPEHPGEWRCTQDLGPVVPKAISPVNTPPVETPSSKTGEGSSTIPDSGEVEIWSRSNGDAMRVKRIEWEGRVLFLPIATTPISQDHQTPPVKTAKLDLTVGRTQMSRSGSGGKGCCKLTGMKSATLVKQKEQSNGGP